jgi:two-component system, cell cycle response regulator DivK
MPKILLVDDEENNRDMLKRRLELRGFEVITAADGPRAIALASAERPDLILMDVMMPEMNGWEATRRIKEDSATKPIPVIALTGKAMPGDRQACLEAGCEEYESKPIVDMAGFVEKVKALLGRSPS